MTVKRLRTEIDADELTHWIALNRVDPWTRERDDLRAGIVARTVYNSRRTGDQEPGKASDFMFKYEPNVEESLGDEDVDAQIDDAFSSMRIAANLQKTQR